ncbi:hypothetical protein D3C78_941920 [compost metagenome]
MALPDFTQCPQRGFLLTRQHQRSISLHGKFTRLRIIAVANRHHAGVLQVAQQTAVGIIDGINWHAVALLTGTYQEVSNVCGEPILFGTVFIPQGKTTLVALHLQQARNANINGRTAFIVRISFDAKRGELRCIGIKRREQPAGRLLQTTIRVSL